MKKRSTVFIYIVGMLCCFQGILFAQSRAQVVGEDLTPGVQRNTSEIKSRKIVVKGENTQMRMAVSSIANEIAESLRGLLGEEDDFQDGRTIYIELSSSSGSLKVRPRVKPFERSDLFIELLVNTRTQVDRDVLAHGVIEVLLYRRGLAEVNSLEDDQMISVPTWLSIGLLEASKWKEDSSKRQVYEHLLKRPDLFTLDQTLSASGMEVRNFDSTNNTFFKASSCALVLSMLNQDNGKEGMREFIDDVALFEGDISELIRRHFPLVNTGANGIHKMWSLQIASMAAPKMTESLTMQESDEKLTELLRFTISDEEGNSKLVPISDYALLTGLTTKQKVLAVDAMRQGVIQLSNRCHPIYRPLLLEYISISGSIVAGENDDIEERLNALAVQRQNILVADERCRDYLDWYQITRAHSVTGDFSGYMRLKERLAMEREQSKDESIDTYLDKVQTIMEH
ncbi:hypothetical protein ACFPK9_03085 [Rubritalea spongiae]|uniref:Uncharacterized protein n=1 Tax=Rubritalea spongiae TaxID=430797 RepID=A0ABW5E353_9BACT